MSALVNLTVDRPGDEMGRSWLDELVTTRTAVCLLRIAAGNGPHVPLTVDAVLNGLPTESGSILVEPIRCGSTAVSTGTHTQRLIT